ncbi:amino acid ABC transporter permease [Deinococcus maricopensis]|uniref:Polar amino acid ABC transporter, inner membrane subunit n=1 Tax=Deinococcus maricopensis (strain DSM 21211 / LMG 22137 / NRRL B-23946 / LB-34) TaxID=709986 RepID=E8U916_DEIML|nr:amino acid ABC transporter permease [Deinococcus maricopensis]ADV67555.1 polar amino acid ABC transporter, inner membrane subunit [Deinococcus maricopensis DSM 21211]
MTSVARPRRTPMSGGALALWVIGAGIAFYLLFLLITLILRKAPEPIGSRADLFVQGAVMTLYLTVASGVIGLILGVVAGLMKTSAYWIVRAPASLYVWLMRGTPLLVQILFVYNALPLLFPPFKALMDWAGTWPIEGGPEIIAGITALALNVGAYNAEVIRAGIQAVPRGQGEAARSLGLSGGQAMLTIILPQALRIVVPPLVNNVVALLKDTSLVSSIALLELTLAGNRVSSETFKPVPSLATIGGVYLALTTVLTFFTDQLERRTKIVSR